MTDTPTEEANTATPPEQTPDQAEVQRMGAVVDDANRRAAEAERRAAYAAGVAAAATQTPRESSKIVDPLENYSQNDLTMSPDEKRRALANAIGLRVEAANQRNRQEMEQRMASERMAMESRFALDMVTSQRPELSDPKNVPNFAAAMTKAKYEADAVGTQLSPAQLATRAAQIYDQIFKPQGAPRPPFIEGGSRPDLQPNQAQMQDQATPQSALERTYGMKKGSIRPMVDPHDSDGIAALNAEYVRAKNVPLFKKGVQSNLDAVLAMSTEQS